MISFMGHTLNGFKTPIQCQVVLRALLLELAVVFKIVGKNKYLYIIKITYEFVTLQTAIHTNIHPFLNVKLSYRSKTAHTKAVLGGKGRDFILFFDNQIKQYFSTYQFLPKGLSVCISHDIFKVGINSQPIVQDKQI